MKRGRSLQSRLTTWVLAVVVAFWLGALGLSWYEARHDLDELLDAHLEQAAALLMLQPAPSSPGEPSRLAVLPRYTDIAAFQVFDRGRLVLRSDNAPDAPMTVFAPGRERGFATVEIGAVTWRVFGVHDAPLERRVFVAERLKSRTDILDALLHSGAIPMLLALPLLAVAVWWAVRRAITPMRKMDALLRERQAHALDPIELDEVPAELAPLLAALNGLLGRIRVSIETDRRFTADAAHELRTPIAAIRMQAQVALGEADSAARGHALAATIAGCDRAARVVEQLLTLSRLEAAGALPLEPVDLASVAQAIVAELSVLAQAKHQRICLLTTDACFVRGDPTLLAVLVRNLVDNAIRYTPAGGTIELATSQREGGGAHLRLEDSGPGMTDTDLRRLGDRFFRVIGSGEAGTGLGWSIARRAAEAQHAELEVRRSDRLGGLFVGVTMASA